MHIELPGLQYCIKTWKNSLICIGSKVFIRTSTSPKDSVICLNSTRPRVIDFFLVIRIADNWQFLFGVIKMICLAALIGLTRTMGNLGELSKALRRRIVDLDKLGRSF